MIQFAHKDILWFLLAAGLMILGYLLYWNHRKRSLVRLGDQGLIEELMPEASPVAQHWKFLLLLTGAGPGNVYGAHIRGWNMDGGMPSIRSAAGLSMRTSV